MKRAYATVMKAEPYWSAEELIMIEWLKHHIINISAKEQNPRYILFYRWCLYQTEQGPDHFYAAQLMSEIKAVKNLAWGRKLQ